MLETIKNEGIQESKERLLNFELLRILSMILIVLHHYTSHGGLATIPEVGINKFIGEFINMGGKLGAVIFIIITGYFMIESKFKIKKLIKLILEVLFYSMLIMVVLILTNQIDFSFKTFLKNLFPISYGQYWFITFYVGIYLFSPFINKLANSLNREKYKVFLILAAFTLVVIPTILVSANLFYNGFIYFVFLYLFGGYIKKYDVKLNKRKALAIICVILIAMMSCSIICTYLGENITIAKKGIYYFHKANSLPILLLAVYIFLFFKEIKIKNSKIISFLGKTSLAVYLISDHPSLRMILWKKILKTQNFWYTSPVILVLHIVISVVGTYLICAMIDIMRIHLVENNIFKIKKFDKLLNQVEEKINI